MRLSHGVEGSKMAELCAEHKKEGMVDVMSKRCAHPSCDKQPTYGVAGGKVAEVCVGHAKEGMVDVTLLREDWRSRSQMPRTTMACRHNGCSRNATYDMKGSAVALTRMWPPWLHQTAVVRRGRKQESRFLRWTRDGRHGGCHQQEVRKP